MIKNVFLDLDDTILDFQKGERKAIRKTFREIGIPDDDKTVERYIEINISCWKALERGEIGRDEVLFGRFQRLFDELEVMLSPSETQKIYESHLAKEYDFIDGAEELLEQFEGCGKYDLYMATNGIPTVQKPRIADSGIGKYFKDIFISEEIGYAKPKKEYFDLCFARIDGFKPEETIIVGDSLTSDISGGINAGILTCHFNPKDKPYGEIRPDYIIKELSELIPLLDGIE